MANRNIPSYTDGIKARNRIAMAKPEPYAPHFDSEIDEETVVFDPPTDPQKGKPGRKRKNPADPKWHTGPELEKLKQDFIPGYAPSAPEPVIQPPIGALKNKHLEAINRMARAKRLSTDEMIDRIIKAYIKAEKADLDDAIKSRIEAQKEFEEIGQRFKAKQPSIS